MDPESYVFFGNRCYVSDRQTRARIVISHGFLKMKRCIYGWVVIWIAAATLSPGRMLFAQDWFEKGNAFFETKRYQEAADAYTKALEENPDL